MNKFVFFDFNFSGLNEFLLDNKLGIFLIILFIIIHIISFKRKNILETKLRTFMTRKVVYINIYDTLIYAIEILKSSGFRHLPIYDDQKLKYYGIISYKDFMLGSMY